MLSGVNEENPDLTHGPHEGAVEESPAFGSSFHCRIRSVCRQDGARGGASRWRSCCAVRRRVGSREFLLIHQLDPSVQPVLRAMADLELFAAATMKNERVMESGAAVLDRLAKETGRDLKALQPVRTIAEVAVPGLTAGTPRAAHGRPRLAIDHVRFVQRVAHTRRKGPLS